MMIRRILSLIGVSKAHILTPTAGSIPSGPLRVKGRSRKILLRKIFLPLFALDSPGPSGVPALRGLSCGWV